MNAQLLATVCLMSSTILSIDFKPGSWTSQFPLRLPISTDLQILIGLILVTLILSALFAIGERITKPVKQSNFWNHLVVPLEKRGTNLGIRRLLYPYLDELEPGLTQPEITSFVPSELPTPLIDSVEHVDAILRNYKDFSDRQLRKILWGLGPFAVVLFISILSFGLILSILPEVITWFVFIAVLLCLPPIIVVMNRALSTQVVRERAWDKHKRKLVYETWIFEQTESIFSSRMQLLQEQLDKLQLAYLTETVKTETAKEEREKLERALIVLRSLSKQEKEGVGVLFEQQNKDLEKDLVNYWEDREQKAKKEADNRAHKERLLGILIGIAISSIFLLIELLLQ